MAGHRAKGGTCPDRRQGLACPQCDALGLQHRREEQKTSRSRPFARELGQRGRDGGRQGGRDTSECSEHLFNPPWAKKSQTR